MKPREWIIKKDRVEISPNHYEAVQIAAGEYIGDGNEVRVVEYSAYNQAIYEMEKAKQGRVDAENSLERFKSDFERYLRKQE